MASDAKLLMKTLLNTKLFPAASALLYGFLALGVAVGRIRRDFYNYFVLVMQPRTRRAAQPD